MLFVYADNFNFAGPKKNRPKGLTLIRKAMFTEQTETIGRYLRCKHRVLEALSPADGNPAHGDIPEPPPKSKTFKPLSDDDKVRAIQYSNGVKPRSER